MPWSGFPWYGQVVVFIVLAIVAVFLFREIILPLLKTIS